VTAAGTDLLADERRARAAQALLGAAQGRPFDDAGLAALRAYDGADLAQEGLPLQLAVAELWRQAGEEIGGYKIGWTSRGARDRGGPGFRPFGFVLASRILPSGSALARGATPSGGLGKEGFVTMGSRLGGPEVTVEEARAAVASVAPAFEVISHRLPDGLPLAARIGNGLNNWGLIVGPRRAPDLPLDALDVELRRDGELIGAATSGPDVVDDPYLSLSRVCALLHASGRALEPGQQLITGSITASVKTAEGGRFEATFGPLGAVAVDFS
jgi:2-keto-4-pentenoate hydratase